MHFRTRALRVRQSFRGLHRASRRRLWTWPPTANSSFTSDDYIMADLLTSNPYGFACSLDSREWSPKEWDPRSCWLDASPGTDLWRKPPAEKFNVTSLMTKMKTGRFISARVTVSASWSRLYDQAGLLLLWPSEDKSGAPAAWIKTGIEFYDSQANFSTVATPKSSTSDWSLVPLKGNSVTIFIERENVNSGDDSATPSNPSLWIYHLDEDGQKKAVREVTWAFGSEHLLDTLSIGIYVARPTKEGSEDGESLSVHFTDFELKAAII